MKALKIFIGLFLFALVSQAQKPQDVSTWFRYLKLDVKSSLVPPKDTLSTADSGAIAILNGILYTKNGKWRSLSGGGGGSVDSSAYISITSPNDSMIIFHRRYGASDTLLFPSSGGGGGGGGGPFYDSVIMASVKRLADSMSSIRAKIDGNISYFGGSDITLGLTNPDSLYSGGFLVRDAHHSGSSLYNHYFDSTTVIQRIPSAVNTYNKGFYAVNRSTATSGNPQFGPSFESEGSLYVSGISQTMRAGFYNQPTLNGTIPENRMVFGSVQNHGSAFPIIQSGYFSDNPTGGRVHFGLGDFNQISLSSHELTANYDLGASGFWYYNIATANSFTITLPSLSTATSFGESEAFFENYGTGTLTVKGNGSENINFNGVSANTLTLAQYKWANIRLNAAGTGWTVFASNNDNASGTYTPTASNGSNILTSGFSVFTFHWIRVGNEVTVDGAINVNGATVANANTTYDITLPISSSLSGGFDVMGMVQCPNIAGTGQVVANTTTHAAKIFFKPVDTLGNTHEIHFKYTID